MTEIVEDELRELWLSVGSYPDLLLTGETVDDSGDAFTIEALSDEASWGSPQPIDVAVQRWMTDGAVASTQGNENRTITFKVVVSAATSLMLAAAEAELVKRSNRPGMLKWVSPEGSPEAPATVFEVWTMHLEHVLDDLDEFQLQRIYGVTITAKPWVRSENLTVADAPAGAGSSPTTISIDDCSSLTGWTGSPQTPTTASGAIKEAAAVFGPAATVRQLTRTGSVTGLGALLYLVIDATTAGGTQTSLQVFLDGGTYELTKVAAIGTVGYWALPTGLASFTQLDIIAVITTIHATTSSLTIADVSATDTIGGIGSRMQLTRSLEVGGSVATSGSIEVASPSATDLGTVLVYTFPANVSDGYNPPLRQYRTGGNTVTPDGAAVSGNHEAFVAAGVSAGTITYVIPGQSLPEASYAILGRFFSTAATTIDVTLAAGIGSFGSPGIIGSVTWATANTWEWGVIGELELPPEALPLGSSLSVAVQIFGAGGTGTQTIDELYLLDITHGSVSLIQTDAVSSPTRLWIDAPDADPVRNRPAVYIGSTDDRSDAVAVPMGQILSLGDHDLDPDGAVVFTVTDGVLDADVTASFYHRWHTHAGD